MGITGTLGPTPRPGYAPGMTFSYEAVKLPFYPHRHQEVRKLKYDRFLFILINLYSQVKLVISRWPIHRFSGQMPNLKAS